jgi:hypothetical protein
MSDTRDNLGKLVTIEDCRRIDPLMRSELESLDIEIRSIVARMSARAIESGGNEIIFSNAISTVLLSIAATLTGTNCHCSGRIDIGSFLARANSAAVWVKNRQERLVMSSARIDPSP